MANQDWVLIEHPKTDGEPVRVTRKAYELVWKPKGFRLARKPSAKKTTVDEGDE